MNRFRPDDEIRTGRSAAGRARGLWLGMSLWLMAQGCSTVSLTDPVCGPSFQPGNVYRSGPYLPDELRRVAVLPITVAYHDAVSEDGRDAMEPVWRSEVSKTRAFEVVFVSRERLQQWTGKEEWAAGEKLPPDFLARMRAVSGCDAVLFCRLTQYHPYAPMKIGWDLKLVDTSPPRIRWAADEVFDAGDPAVVNAARRYYQTHARQPDLLASSSSILLSPSRFGQYTAHAMLSTLPAR